MAATARPTSRLAKVQQATRLTMFLVASAASRAACSALALASWNFCFASPYILFHFSSVLLASSFVMPVRSTIVFSSSSRSPVARFSRTAP